jgi:hypothetical protein
MAAKVKLTEDQSFVRGRSTKVAKSLVQRAKDAGLEGSIITTAFGYIAPTSILTDKEIASDDFSNVLPDGTVPVEGEEAGDENSEPESPGGEPEAAAAADEPEASAAGEPEEPATEESAAPPAPEAPPTEGPGASGSFDPSTKTVEEVLNYLSAQDAAEKGRVIAVERSGKNRKTITDTEGV